jgi:hypothetical protein
MVDSDTEDNAAFDEINLKRLYDKIVLLIVPKRRE